MSVWSFLPQENAGRCIVPCEFSWPQVVGPVCHQGIRRRLLTNAKPVSEQDLLHLYGASAEFVRGQRYGLPLRTADGHEVAVVVQPDAKEYVCAAFELVDFPAVEIDVDVFDSVCEDKGCDVTLAENLLPSGPRRAGWAGYRYTRRL